MPTPSCPHTWANQGAQPQLRSSTGALALPGASFKPSLFFPEGLKAAATAVGLV